MAVGFYWRSFSTFIALIPGFLLDMAVIGWQLEVVSNLHSSDSGVLSRHSGIGLVVGLYWRSFPTFIALIPGCLLDMVVLGWQLEVISNLPSCDSRIPHLAHSQSHAKEVVESPHLEVFRKH